MTMGCVPVFAEEPAEQVLHYGAQGELEAGAYDIRVKFTWVGGSAKAKSYLPTDYNNISSGYMDTNAKLIVKEDAQNGKNSYAMQVFSCLKSVTTNLDTKEETESINTSSLKKAQKDGETYSAAGEELLPTTSDTLQRRFKSRGVESSLDGYWGWSNEIPIDTLDSQVYIYAKMGKNNYEAYYKVEYELKENESGSYITIPDGKEPVIEVGELKLKDDEVAIYTRKDGKVALGALSFFNIYVAAQGSSPARKAVYSYSIDDGATWHAAYEVQPKSRDVSGTEGGVLQIGRRGSNKDNYKDNDIEVEDKATEFHIMIKAEIEGCDEISQVERNYSFTPKGISYIRRDDGMTYFSAANSIPYDSRLVTEMITDTVTLREIKNKMIAQNVADVEDIVAFKFDVVDENGDSAENISGTWDPATTDPIASSDKFWGSAAYSTNQIIVSQSFAGEDCNLAFAKLYKISGEDVASGTLSDSIMKTTPGAVANLGTAQYTLTATGDAAPPKGIYILKKNKYLPLKAAYDSSEHAREMIYNGVSYGFYYALQCDAIQNGYYKIIAKAMQKEHWGQSSPVNAYIDGRALLQVEDIQAKSIDVVNDDYSQIHTLEEAYTNAKATAYLSFVPVNGVYVESVKIGGQEVACFEEYTVDGRVYPKKVRIMSQQKDADAYIPAVVKLSNGNEYELQFALDYGYVSNSVIKTRYAASGLEAAAPTVTTKTGKFKFTNDDKAKVSLSTTSVNGTIHYTVNVKGSTGAEEKTYTEPFELTADGTTEGKVYVIEAYTTKDGVKDSAKTKAVIEFRKEGAYAYDVQTPNVFPRYREGNSAEKGKYLLEISSKTEGADIYYTTDGSIPEKSDTPQQDNGSTKWYNPQNPPTIDAMTDGQATVIKTIAYKDGMNDSEVASQNIVFSTNWWDSVYDGDSFDVGVEMLQYISKKGKTVYSMGNGALTHKAKIYKENGKINVGIEFKPINMDLILGHLIDFWYFENQEVVSHSADLAFLTQYGKKSDYSYNDEGYLSWVTIPGINDMLDENNWAIVALESDFAPMGKQFAKMKFDFDSAIEKVTGKAPEKEKVVDPPEITSTLNAKADAIEFSLSIANQVNPLNKDAIIYYKVTAEDTADLSEMSEYTGTFSITDEEVRSMRKANGDGTLNVLAIAKNGNIISAMATKKFLLGQKFESIAIEGKNNFVPDFSAKVDDVLKDENRSQIKLAVEVKGAPSESNRNKALAAANITLANLKQISAWKLDIQNSDKLCNQPIQLVFPKSNYKGTISLLRQTAAGVQKAGNALDNEDYEYEPITITDNGTSYAASINQSGTYVLLEQASSSTGGNTGNDVVDAKKDGKYWVSFNLWKNSSDEASMGNVAFENNREALLTTQGGEYTLEIATNPVNVGGIVSALKDMRFKGKKGWQDVTEIKRASITAKGYKDEVSFEYLSQLSLELPSVSDEYVEVKVNVPYTPMDNISQNDGTNFIPARLKIDWSSIRKAAPNEKLVPTASVASSAFSIESEAADLKDEETGIRLEAGENVLESGAKLHVESLTKGKYMDLAEKALKDEVENFQLYQILTKVKDVEVSPTKNVTLYLPLPKGMDKTKFLLYRLGEEGEKTLIKGEFKENQFVFETNLLGVFALCQSNQVVTPIEENVQTTEEVQEIFGDISNHWAKDAILFAVANGIFTGVSETDFMPDAKMTRGMFVTVLGRVAGVSPDMYYGEVFSDITATDYYSSYATWAKAKGVVSGMPDGSFAPNTQITREQMAVMLSQYAKAYGIQWKDESKKVFTDANQINSWALDSVNSLAGAGILSGRENGDFDPKGAATRAECAMMLMNFMKQYVNSSKNSEEKTEINE